MLDGLLNFLTNYKIVDIWIVMIGLFGIALAFDRFRALYFEYSLPTESFMKEILSLVEQDKIEEAITYCAANEKKPLAMIIKRVLEKSDQDDDAMEAALDIAASETAPKLVKSLGHISMVANVVTLVGLLGTVVGLITAFRAVSFADVAQKQTLLAEGISIAMTATALGLLFAIPCMIMYSFLHSKQSRLFSEIDLCSQKLMETLHSRIYQPFKTAQAFPNNLKVEAMNHNSKPSAKVS